MLAFFVVSQVVIDFWGGRWDSKIKKPNNLLRVALSPGESPGGTNLPGRVGYAGNHAHLWIP